MEGKLNSNLTNDAFQVNASNFRHHDLYSENVFYDLIPVKTAAYCLLLLVSVLGNIFIITTVCKDERLKTTTNFLVANLAVSDFIASFFLVPLQLTRLYFGKKWFIMGEFGDALCKLSIFIPDTSTSVSFYSCVFIAFDRYLAVAHPLRGGFSRSRLKYIIPGIWIFSALNVSPYFYSFKLVTSHNSHFCFYEDERFLKAHFYFLVVVNFVIPMPIITTLYSMIVYKLRRHKAPGNTTDVALERRRQQNNKVTKMSITIVSLQFLSWAYFSVIVILSWEGIMIKSRILSDIVYFSGNFIVDMSYSYNFFIYLVFNGIYRENFKRIISKCICRGACSAVVVRPDIAGIENSTCNGGEDQTRTLHMETLNPS
ncbi:neuromedin-K receptor-like [Exaiptasia diaphana]|uniref:G-protein coupled receptors family 1 profile domain-containing protein n=1 Tax=Exaiptasia diaphana TaxID=2652724 RepID=A0A913YXN0_EXADI|nr:neuromedin-K receptor-like [Exaiptasia diaphana]